jgi:hypothetical protein
MTVQHNRGVLICGLTETLSLLCAEYIKLTHKWEAMSLCHSVCFIPKITEQISINFDTGISIRSYPADFIFVQIVQTQVPPLWSSGQSFWLQIQRSQVRFPALPDFLRSRGVWNGVHSAS